MRWYKWYVLMVISELVWIYIEKKLIISSQPQPFGIRFNRPVCVFPHRHKSSSQEIDWDRYVFWRFLGAYSCAWVQEAELLEGSLESSHTEKAQVFGAHQSLDEGCPQGEGRYNAGQSSSLWLTGTPGQKTSSELSATNTPGSRRLECLSWALPHSAQTHTTLVLIEA